MRETFALACVYLAARGVWRWRCYDDEVWILLMYVPTVGYSWILVMELEPVGMDVER